MKVSVPVCHSSTAPPWRGLVQCIELTMQRSSTWPATWGNTSLTAAPDSPWRRKPKGDPPRLPWRSGNESTLGLAKGSGRPCSATRRGLGSKLSMWLGPPNMNSMITRLARGATPDGRGRSTSSPSAAAASASSPVSASEPNPAPRSERNRRRCPVVCVIGYSM